MSTRSLFRVRHTRACALVSAGVSLVLGVAVACSDSTGPTLPARMQIVTGDSQTAIVATQLALPLLVAVVDSIGNAAKGIPVTFTTSDSGSFSSATVTTDSLGHASTTFTLGKKAEAITLKAFVANLPPAIFSITAIPAPAADVAKVSGDGQSGSAGTKLSAPFVVQVLDEFGNPIVGATVVWSTTDGTFATTDALTDANGRATAVLTLGASGDQATVTAHVAGAADATFTATAQ